ncbi:MAG: glycosyltransferase family 9 protein [Magnetovibrio sp.]|nr:glycosyltransferase family 9 protein [Magnetovibrio sp.]
MSEADLPTTKITSGAFWRLLPAGMRRRWWLFRLFDWLARHWPVLKSRRGLLVIRMDGIGDMMLFRASLDDYAAAFGVEPSDITVLGCKSWEPIAADVFAGYRVIAIDEHAYARRPLYRFRVNLRVRALAPRVTASDAYFRRALMADSLAWVAGAPRTVVSLPYMSERTRAEYTWYLSQGAEVIDTGAYPIHETERHANFVAAVGGGAAAPRATSIDWPSAPPAEVDGPYAVLNPGSNEFGRRWPLAQYVTLARKLRERGLQVVFVGKADEKAADPALREIAGEAGVHDLTGRTSLAGLLGVMKGARLVVSNDTGPAHVGIALGTPTVVIVGGGHFGCFVPYPETVRPAHARFVHEPMDCYHCFWRCHKRSDPKASFPCVAAVGMAAVEAACDDLLALSPDA